MLGAPRLAVFSSCFLAVTWPAKKNVFSALLLLDLLGSEGSQVEQDHKQNIKNNLSENTVGFFKGQSIFNIDIPKVCTGRNKITVSPELLSTSNCLINLRQKYYP